jgi:hypothetical protein
MADGIIVPIGQPGADTVGLFTQLMQSAGPLGPLVKALGELSARQQKETQLQQLPDLQQQVCSIKPMLLMILGEKACAVHLAKLDSRRTAAQAAGAAAVLAGAITAAEMQQQLAQADASPPELYGIDADEPDDAGDGGADEPDDELHLSDSASDLEQQQQQQDRSALAEFDEACSALIKAHQELRIKENKCQAEVWQQLAPLLLTSAGGRCQDLLVKEALRHVIEVAVVYPMRMWGAPSANPWGQDFKPPMDEERGGGRHLMGFLTRCSNRARAAGQQQHRVAVLQALLEATALQRQHACSLLQPHTTPQALPAAQQALLQQLAAPMQERFDSFEQRWLSGATLRRQLDKHCLAPLQQLFMLRLLSQCSAAAATGSVITAGAPPDVAPRLAGIAGLGRKRFAELHDFQSSAAGRELLDKATKSRHVTTKELRMLMELGQSKTVSLAI